MKISRQAPLRRRRSSFPLVPTIVAILFVGLLVAAWMKGGPQPQKPVEISIPPEQLGH